MASAPRPARRITPGEEEGVLVVVSHKMGPYLGVERSVEEEKEEEVAAGGHQASSSSGAGARAEAGAWQKGRGQGPGA